MQPGFFVPAIQAITFPQTRPIPPTELLPSAFNVPMRPVVLPSISVLLMVFLVGLFYWMNQQLFRCTTSNPRQIRYCRQWAFRLFLYVPKVFPNPFKVFLE
ncbi:hypothetical protein BKX96_04475 [Pseudomonas putida]|nr:hypothetical protein BKX96_04475 [Pseudomonas putida]